MSGIFLGIHGFGPKTTSKVKKDFNLKATMSTAGDIGDALVAKGVEHMQVCAAL
jgi:hypothetical protein